MPERLAPGDQAGAETLEIMAAAPNYNTWMYDAIAPYLGRSVLEVGSGIGNMSEQMLKRGVDRLVLTDMDPWYREQLASRFADRPEVRVDSLMLPDPDAAARFRDDRLDTIVALNVVEHIEDDIGALQTMRGMLVPGVGSSSWCLRSKPYTARWIASWGTSAATASEVWPRSFDGPVFAWTTWRGGIGSGWRAGGSTVGSAR